MQLSNVWSLPAEALVSMPVYTQTRPHSITVGSSARFDQGVAVVRWWPYSILWLNNKGTGALGKDISVFSPHQRRGQTFWATIGSERCPPPSCNPNLAMQGNIREDMIFLTNKYNFCWMNSLEPGGQLFQKLVSLCLPACHMLVTGLFSTILLHTVCDTIFFFCTNNSTFSREKFGVYPFSSVCI